MVVWIALMVVPRIAAAVPAHIGRLALTTSSDASISFPNTPVGQTSTSCHGLCYSKNTSPPDSCDGSGPAVIDHDVSTPFLVNNYRINNSNAGCGGKPVTMPTSINAGEALVFDTSFSPTRNGSFSDTLTISGFNIDLSGSTGSAASDCAPGPTTLCIDQNAGDRRFMIQTSYHTSEGGGRSGAGTAIALSSLGITDGGLFWFFGATNPEMLIKIIDGCSLTSHFWVFYAATTNVGFTVTVTDTTSGHQAVYENPDQTAAPPVQDSSALSCP